MWCGRWPTREERGGEARGPVEERRGRIVLEVRRGVLFFLSLLMRYVVARVVDGSIGWLVGLWWAMRSKERVATSVQRCCNAPPTPNCDARIKTRPKQRVFSAALLTFRGSGTGVVCGGGGVEGHVTIVIETECEIFCCLQSPRRGATYPTPAFYQLRTHTLM